MSKMARATRTASRLREDDIPNNRIEAYAFLNRARTHWMERVRDTGVVDSSVYDTLQFLQYAMTSVMSTPEAIVYLD